ncbi:hypothetical protein [Pseudonocardia sp. TRM90224]|uniref:hypothetical protein n=1 Tax=Pseudonocardia sp. TRM90224 TaxID=2812678 RepID=UPI001E465E20|nr:hypothetical protein [Pseudonocardia sp. TRM90224]
MIDIGYYLYENIPLQEKASWTTTAVGSAAVDPTRAMLGNMGISYVDSDQAVDTVMTEMGVTWAGDAAVAAGQVLHTAANRGGTVGAAGQGGSGSVDGYGRSFDDMRGKVFWKDPGAYDWLDLAIDVYGTSLNSVGLFEIQSDFMATVDENRTSEAAANRALYDHEAQSRAAVGAFPTIETASVAPNGGPTGPGPALPPQTPLGAGPVPAATTFTPVTGVLPNGPQPAPVGLPAGPTLTALPNGVPPPTANIPPGPAVPPLPGTPLDRLGPALPTTASNTSAYPPPFQAFDQNKPTAGSRPPAPGWRNPASSGIPNRTTGHDFGTKLSSGNEPHGQRPGSPGGPGPQGARPLGHGTPFMGTAGAGGGDQPTERKTRYWIPSTEAFDVPLPPHTEGVIEGRDE